MGKREIKDDNSLENTIKIIDIVTPSGVVPVKIDARTNKPLEVRNQIDSSEGNVYSNLHDEPTILFATPAGCIEVSITCMRDANLSLFEELMGECNNDPELLSEFIWN